MNLATKYKTYVVLYLLALTVNISIGIHVWKTSGSFDNEIDRLKNRKKELADSGQLNRLAEIVLDENIDAQNMKKDIDFALIFFLGMYASKNGINAYLSRKNYLSEKNKEQKIRNG